jgi:hypothetical protein
MLAAVRWISTGAALLVLVLWIANLPFYAGAPVGDHYKWRMEHGRVRVTRWADPPQRKQTFYVAANSEGLRWSWEWRRYGEGSWSLTVPLWAPFLLFAGIAAATWRQARRRRVATSDSSA